jgi:hypothetical protein
MSELMIFIAGFFLPLFPLSMVFNALLARVRQPVLRAILLLVWPQVGLALLATANQAVPAWSVSWALFTAALYGLRALVLREVGLWIGFLATSAWAVLWIPALGGTSTPLVQLYALGFSAPFMLLALLTAGLEQRFGAAYTGLYGGLAQNLPRFSGVLVMVILATIATPLFPAFFAMLASILVAKPGAAVALLGIWLLWSWAGARLLQGLVVGPTNPQDSPDLSLVATWLYALVLVALVVGGVYLIGDLP